MQVVEGYPTAKEVVLLAKQRNLKLPLYFGERNTEHNTA